MAMTSIVSHISCGKVKTGEKTVRIMITRQADCAIRWRNIGQRNRVSRATTSSEFNYNKGCLVLL